MYLVQSAAYKSRNIQCSIISRPLQVHVYTLLLVDTLPSSELPFSIAAVMARSKLTWIVVVWMAVLTLLPAYLLLSRKYTLIRNDGNTNNSELQSSQKTTELEHFKTQSGELNTVGSDRLQAELERILTVDWSDPRAPFEQVVALSSLLPKITDISRMKTPSPEAFRNYIAPIGLPVIFTDMLEGQLLSRWNWDYVKTKWGDHIFHNTRQGNYSTKTTKAGKYDVNRVSVRLADFIDVVTGARDASEAEKGMYITKQRVIPVEALEREFYYPPFYPGSHKNCYLEPTGWYVVQHNEAEAPTGTLAGQPLFCKKELACETTTRLPLLYDNEGKQVYVQSHVCISRPSNFACNG